MTATAANVFTMPSVVASYALVHRCSAASIPVVVNGLHPTRLA
jgi:hypothetical protein